MLRRGQQVDRYVVEGRIGEGGMAAVYRVRHHTLGSLAALKVVTTRSPEVHRRLLLEGKVQAALQHPHIVRVTDVLEIDGAPGLLMEFVEGPTLEKWLTQYQPSLPEALSLFRGIVCGVGHAHATGHIHRDLKPANVMLSVTEERMVPKVADFGLAKALDSSRLESTREGATMGTPAYMSPEQIRDASTVDRRADLWSLGCILYRLVCGVPAFEGDDIIELFNQVANGDYPPSRVIRPGLPDRIHEIISGLLHTRREGRVADCADLLSYLDERRDVLTRPDGTLAKAPKPHTEEPTWLEGPHAGIQIALDQFEDAQRRLPKLNWGEDGAEEPSSITDARTFAPRRGSSEASAVPDSVLIPPRRPLTRRWWVWAAGIGALAGGGLVGLVALVVAFAVLQTGQFALLWTADDPADTTAPILPVEDTMTVGLVPVAPLDPIPDEGIPPTPGPVRPPPDQATVAPAVPDPVVPDPVVPKGPQEAFATVSFTGAERLWLEGDENQRIQRNLARVPPGSYDIHAEFSGEASVVAGRVTLIAGQDITLRCVADFSRCRAF